MPLYEKYVGRSRDDFATLEDLQKNYKVTVGDDFNYAYDVVDEIASQPRNMLTNKPKKPQVMKSVTVDTQGVEYPEPEKLADPFRR